MDSMEKSIESESRRDFSRSQQQPRWPRSVDGLMLREAITRQHEVQVAPGISELIDVDRST